jgi:hypothetical protein
MRRLAVYQHQKRKRTTWLRTVGGGGRSASHGPDLRQAGARRADERSNSFKRRLGFCGTQKEYLTHAAPPPFIHRTRRFGKPAVQLCRVRQQSHQKPPRNHFERGQRLHHLATPSAPDDLVELVPRRTNVGAKAKTPPFARCLHRSHRTNGGEAAGSSHPSSNMLQDEGYDEVAPSRVLVQHEGPCRIWPIVTAPARLSALRARFVKAFL